MRTLLLTTLTMLSLGVSANAYADRGDWHGRGHERDHRGHYSRGHSSSFTIGIYGVPYYYPVAQPVYASPPQPVYIQPAAYEEPGYCREYTRNVRVGGRLVQSYGQACQQPDGTWHIMN